MELARDWRRMLSRLRRVRVNDAILDEEKYVSSDGCWWNPGLTRHYHDAVGYYLPSKTVDPFGAETAVTYDKYNLVPVTVTDALGNTTQAEIDYHTLQPARIIDINDNTSEVLFDALGIVIATTIYGQEGELNAGDKPLYKPDQKEARLEPFLGLQLTPDKYESRGNASLQNILNDVQLCTDGKKTKSDYLQDATSYFFYDLFSWQDRQQPPHSVSLMRETHVHDLHADEPTNIQVQIAYSDGFGRALQTKVKAGFGLAIRLDTDRKLVEAPAAVRWLTSGRTVYNNKGKPVKQYEPFYTATPKYIPEPKLTQHGVTHVTHYDPLLRVVRVTKPDGFFSKVEFTPWEEKHYDENDTVKESPFFVAHNDKAAKHDDKVGLDPAVRDSAKEDGALREHVEGELKKKGFHGTRLVSVRQNGGGEIEIGDDLFPVNLKRGSLKLEEITMLVYPKPERASQAGSERKPKTEKVSAQENPADTNTGQHRKWKISVPREQVDSMGDVILLVPFSGDLDWGTTG